MENALWRCGAREKSDEGRTWASGEITELALVDRECMRVMRLCNCWCDCVSQRKDVIGKSKANAREENWKY